MSSEIASRVPDVVVVEHLDPEKLVPGGIDTIIQDMIKFSPNTRFAIVGISTNERLQRGKWSQVEIGGRRVPFLPVSSFDRTKTETVHCPHSLRFAWGLIANRRKIPHTVIHAHRIETGSLMICLGFGNTVQFVHNAAGNLSGRNSDSRWKRLGWLYSILERYVLKRASAIAVFNAQEASRLQKSRPDAIAVRTWYDPGVFSCTRFRPDNSGRLVVCTVGRLELQKDPLLAIEAFARVLEKESTAVLRIAGVGSMKQRVFARASELGVEERVHFEGALSRDDVAKLMSTSSVLLLTSHYEGSPTVLVEAAATGLPVVATTEADSDQVLVRGVNGIAVPGRDPICLAEAILEARHYSGSACVASASERSAEFAVKRLVELGRKTTP